jgi:nicotinamide-nucleotide amidase
VSAPEQTLLQLAAAALDAARASGRTLGTVESCTGGLIAAALTEIAGSSDVVMGGLVTYSNGLKTALAGVSPELLTAHGAVSEPVARAMAEGGLERLGVSRCVAVTGIAGPGGATPGKPVGLVHLAVATVGAPTIHEMREFGAIGRDQVRRETVLAALRLLALP